MGEGVCSVIFFPCPSNPYSFHTHHGTVTNKQLMQAAVAKVQTRGSLRLHGSQRNFPSSHLQNCVSFCLFVCALLLSVEWIPYRQEAALLIPMFTELGRKSNLRMCKEVNHVGLSPTKRGAGYLNCEGPQCLKGYGAVPNIWLQNSRLVSSEYKLTKIQN